MSVVENCNYFLKVGLSTSEILKPLDYISMNVFVSVNHGFGNLVTNVLCTPVKGVAHGGRLSTNDRMRMVHYEQNASLS